MEEQTKTESEGAPESLALVMFSGFSRAAIDSLKEVLLGEDDDTESKKRRSIYMKIAINSCASNGIDEGWLRLDTKAKDDDDDGLSPRLSPSCVFPPQLQDVEDYGCAAWDSRIIIAGGWFVQKIRLSNKVYVYDTDTEEWDQLPPMIAERGSDPVVAVADDIIFVFDGNPQHDDIWGVGEDLAHSKIQLWAEYYDSKSQNPSWKCFPRLPPIELLQYPALSSYALYTKGSLIFFYIGRVVSFNYSTWDWIIYDVGDHPIAKCLKCVEWSAAAVVIDHFLFWYDDKTIYGHDLSMSEGGVILPVFSFDGTSNFCYPMHNFRGITFRSDETYLVRVGGKNELCLFWYEKKDTIRYFIFRVQICLGAATLRLVLTQTGLLESMVSYVERALEVSSIKKNISEMGEKEEKEVEEKEEKHGEEKSKDKEKKKKKEKNGEGEEDKEGGVKKEKKKKNPEDKNDPQKLKAKLEKVETKMQALAVKKEEILNLLKGASEPKLE